jgi:Raf kinase inhibitor-like YbhB/YbcL family protein
MILTSPDFKNNSPMPVRFTCQGDDVSPDLDIAMVPPEARSLALIVDDPGASMGTWDHWIVYNIPSATTHIPSGTVPGIEAWNSFGQTAWGGPCPPSGTHRYFFKLYALDKHLELGPKARKTDVEIAMAGHILAQAELVGLYKKR